MSEALGIVSSICSIISLAGRLASHLRSLEGGTSGLHDLLCETQGKTSILHQIQNTELILESFNQRATKSSSDDLSNSMDTLGKLEVIDRTKWKGQPRSVIRARFKKEILCNLRNDFLWLVYCISEAKRELNQLECSLHSEIDKIRVKMNHTLGNAQCPPIQRPPNKQEKQLRERTPEESRTLFDHILEHQECAGSDMTDELGISPILLELSCSATSLGLDTSPISLDLNMPPVSLELDTFSVSMGIRGDRSAVKPCNLCERNNFSEGWLWTGQSTTTFLQQLCSKFTSHVWTMGIGIFPGGRLSLPRAGIAFLFLAHSTSADATISSETRSMELEMELEMNRVSLSNGHDKSSTLGAPWINLIINPAQQQQTRDLQPLELLFATLTAVGFIAVLGQLRRKDRFQAHFVAGCALIATIAAPIQDVNVVEFLFRYLFWGSFIGLLMSWVAHVVFDVGRVKMDFKYCIPKKLENSSSIADTEKPAILETKY